MRSPADVLAAAQQMLANAELGLRDITSDDPARRVPGLHNVATFGRAVTIALQRLRNIVRGFDEWYASRIPDDDPLLAYFNDLRNKILKEAANPTFSTSVYIESFKGSPHEILKGPPPVGATGVFVGEGGTGGSGWIVRMPDGSEGKFYGALSEQFRGQVTIHLPEAPTTFLGRDIEDTTAAGIAGAYVAWLREMVDDAAVRFSPSSSD